MKYIWTVCHGQTFKICRFAIKISVLKDWDIPKMEKADIFLRKNAEKQDMNQYWYRYRFTSNRNGWEQHEILTSYIAQQSHYKRTGIWSSRDRWCDSFPFNSVDILLFDRQQREIEKVITMEFRLYFFVWWGGIFISRVFDLDSTFAKDQVGKNLAFHIAFKSFQLRVWYEMVIAHSIQR